MKTTHLLIIFLHFLPMQLIGQNSEQIIESVRDRYYRINNGTIELTKITFQNSDYYLENSKISIIKRKTEDGQFEYYFDTKSNEYYPYFIYFSSNNQELKPDIRAYYGNNFPLIALKLNQETVPINPHNPHGHNFFYLRKDAFNELNKLLNLFELSNYQDDLKTDEINKKIDLLKKTITRADTITKIENEHEYQLEMAFINSRGDIVKRTKHYESEHSGSTKYSYYENSIQILKITEGESWVGNFTEAYITKEYYKNGQIYRSDTYRSHGDTPSSSKNKNVDISYSTSDMIPRIKYHKQ